MRVLVTGGTGFIGRGLIDALVRRGDAVVALTRRTDAPAARDLARLGNVRLVSWSEPWASPLPDVDAVVNLAGEPVVGRRWSAAQKARIRDSRVGVTRALVDAILAASRPPAVFVSASAVGYYGARGDDTLDESSAPGSDFLARVCVDWESEAARAEARVRTVLLRIGIVLGDDGGSLAEMVRPFRFAMGGPIGSGRQWVSWIHHADAVRMLLHALDTPAMAGPVNATAPTPVRQSALADAIGKALARPSWLPVPKVALRVALGEVATMLVEGQRVEPKRALASGFVFLHPDLREALVGLLHR